MVAVVAVVAVVPVVTMVAVVPWLPWDGGRPHPILYMDQPVWGALWISGSLWSTLVCLG